VSKSLAVASAEPTALSAVDATAVIAAEVRKSVSAHLVSDVPVGVFLSAGLDSTMIAGCAAGTSTLRTVTLGFDEYSGTANDEVPLAEDTARSLGARHATVRVRRSDFEGERAKLLAAMDQPSIDGVNTWFVARATAAQGLKVALSGLGGDELFGSYSSFRDVPLLARLLSPIAGLSGLGVAMRVVSAPVLRQFTSPKYAGLLEYGGTVGGAYLLRRGLFMPWELPEVLDPDLAREGWRTLETRAQLRATTSGIGNSRLAVSALELCWYMRHQLLRDADWAGMAHSLEIRVPLADMMLLRGVGPILSGCPDVSKRQVAAAAAPQLPSTLLDRPKTGFSVPVRSWMLGANEKSERGLRGWARHVYAEMASEA
jgi:asparagine synthase (glutamine-hydrolysing)